MNKRYLIGIALIVISGSMAVETSTTNNGFEIWLVFMSIFLGAMGLGVLCGLLFNK